MRIGRIVLGRWLVLVASMALVGCNNIAAEREESADGAFLEGQSTGRELEERDAEVGTAIGNVAARLFGRHGEGRAGDDGRTVQPHGFEDLGEAEVHDLEHRLRPSGDPVAVQVALSAVG